VANVVRSAATAGTGLLDGRRGQINGTIKLTIVKSAELLQKPDHDVLSTSE